MTFCYQNSYTELHLERKSHLYSLSGPSTIVVSLETQHCNRVLRREDNLPTLASIILANPRFLSLNILPAGRDEWGTLSAFVAPQWMTAWQCHRMLWYTGVCFDPLTRPLAGNRVWYAHWQSVWTLSCAGHPQWCNSIRKMLHLWMALTGSGEGVRTRESVWRQARGTVIGSKRNFLTPSLLWWGINARQLQKNVLEQKCSFILGVMFRGRR